MIRTVLIDDEPPARRKLRRLLETEPDFEIVGEAESAAGALEVIRSKKPDLVFLDVGLPDATGFDLLRSVEGEKLPHIVFVTAYDDFALEAFEVHALDYLLKPVEPSRFAASLRKIRRFLQLGETQEIASRLDRLVASLQAENHYVQRLLIQEDERSIFLDVNRIDWIESARNYACIHAGALTHIQRMTLDSLGAKLDPKSFRRVNRSQIVNMRSIAEVRSWFHGDSRIVLRDGTELNWSRRYQPASMSDLERA